MKIVVEGVEYQWDASQMLYSEGRFLQKTLKMTHREWNDALKQQDIEAVGALVYFLRKRAGEDPDWDNLEFDMNSLRYIPESRDEIDEEPAPKEATPAVA